MPYRLFGIAALLGIRCFHCKMLHCKSRFYFSFLMEIWIVVCGDGWGWLLRRQGGCLDNVETIFSGSPSYFSSLINFNNPSIPLHSSSLSLLHVPFTAKAIGCKAFRFAAPTVWNSVPQNIRLLVLLKSQNSPLFPSRLAMFPTSLHQRLWLEPAWICALYKFCNNNNNNNNNNKSMWRVIRQLKNHESMKCQLSQNTWIIHNAS